MAGDGKSAVNAAQAKLDEAMRMRTGLNNALAMKKKQVADLNKEIEAYDGRIGDIMVKISAASKELEAAKSSYKKTIGK